MSLPVLNATEQRMLGSLLEKQKTVPASYPLSLNSLRLACNQSSNREPVTDLSDRDLQDGARELKDRGLLRLVWAGKGSRVVKYHQLLDEVLALSDDERAVLTMLLLRGAQSAGELKARTERLHPFTDRVDVEASLSRMAAAVEPLVRELPQRGRDSRWIHLLGPVSGTAEPVQAPVDLESVLAEGAASRDAKVFAAYEAVAARYSERHLNELAEKPFDRWLLKRIAAAADGPIADLGCGPGHLAAFLADNGAEVVGLDASPAMITQARANFGDLIFEVGRFDQLLRPSNAAAWGAIVAWYALVHLTPSELADTLESVVPTLRPGGLMALALHVGGEVLHFDEFLGAEVDLDFVLSEPAQVLEAVAAAGLVVDEWYLRSPVGSEYPTKRLYLLAHRTN